MASKKTDHETRLAELEKSIQKMEKALAKVSEKLEKEKKETKSLSRKMDTRIKREGIMMDALGMSTKTRKGDKAALGNLNDSIIKLEEYLLRTSDRIDNILTSLKNHREFLVRMNKKVFKVGTRERIQMELDIMKNTLGVLSISGVNFDETLFRDIKRLKTASADPSISPSDLKKGKERLDKKFGDEMERFDLDNIWRKRKDIPGYI